LLKEIEKLYIISWAGDSPYWTLGNSKDRERIDPEYVWGYFKTNEKGIGVCVDAAAFFDSIYKSLGLASLPTEHWGIRKDNQKEEGHAFVLYYIPTKQSWKTYSQQVNVVTTAYTEPFGLHIFIPPIREKDVIDMHYKMNEKSCEKLSFLNLSLKEYLKLQNISSKKLKKELWKFYF